MGDLIPEKRLNRLGQWVTKHVRRPRIDSKTAIPAPTTGSLEAPRSVHGGASTVEARVARGIADGRISREHVERLGLRRIQDAVASDAVIGVLAQMHEGASPCTPETLGAFMDLASQLQLDADEFTALTSILKHVDLNHEVPEEDWHLLSMLRGYDGYSRGEGVQEPLAEAEAAQHAAYFVRVSPRALDTGDLRKAAEFLAAGIPADLARDVLEAGGTIQQAKAIRDGDAHPGLSSGAL